MIKIHRQSGLTIIELMIALAISGLLLAGMVMAFTAQSKSYNTQQEITTLQQNMWATLQLMSREIKMAGFNPNGIAGTPATGPGSAPGVAVASASTLEIDQDLNHNGAITDTAADPNEHIVYSYSAAGGLTRSSNGGGAQQIMNNVTNMAFEYQTMTKNGNQPWAWAWTQAPANLKRIRVVKICIQAQTNRQTSISTDMSGSIPPIQSQAYDWTPPASDNFQRRIMCTDVNLRNMIN